MINYFEPAATAEEEIIRRIKGNYRRRFIARVRQSFGAQFAIPYGSTHCSCVSITLPAES